MSSREPDLFVFRQSSHSGRFAHFHDCQFPVFNPRVTCIDFATDGIVRFAFQPRTAARFANRFRGPLSSVRHRHDFDLSIRQDFVQPFRDVFRNITRV